MAEEVKNSNITISSLEDTGQQIKIRDQNNRTYSFFKTKKDGGETIAYQNFQNYKIGDTIEISFKEVPYKDGSIKNVIAVRPATGQPHAEEVLSRRGRKSRPEEREYWERREAKRQNSIVLQVAFKAAVELQSADIRSGSKLDKKKLYNDTKEFYDWIIGQVGEVSKTPREAPDDDIETPF